MRSERHIPPVLATALLLVAAAASRAPAQAPTLTGSSPRAVRPGATTEMTIRGSNLSAPVRLTGTLVPPPGTTVAFNDGGADRAVWKVDIPPDHAVGLGVIRLSTRNGVSNLLPIMVDDLSTVAAATGNSSLGTAQAITPPAGVEGVADAGAADYFRFAAKKGQRVSVEVVAARLGSQLDPAVRLLDAAGKELVALDDTPGIGPDCRFAHRFAADGDYVLELRDSTYAGGSEFHYRLRVGDFPLPAVSFPLGARRGTRPPFKPLGIDCAGVAPVTPGPGDFRRRLPISFRYDGARGKASGSGFVAAAVGDHEEIIEAEPNDAPEQATPIAALPVGISGTLERDGDRDFYQFPGKKGQRLSFTARTRSIGSPCDVRLRLLKPDGSKLAESKVEGPGEGTVDATLPDDGAYRLMVEDINRAGGPGLAYRVEAGPYEAGFSLSVDTDRVNARPGESFDVKVTCVRRDYTGPLTLSIDGSGLTSEPATIAAGKNDAVLKGKAPAQARNDSPLPFRIVGGAEVGGRRVTAEASTMPALRRVYPRLLYPPDDTDGLLVLGVREPAE